MTPEAANPQLPCARCGAFITGRADLKLLHGRVYCATCAARPDVDHLEAFRLKYWGKRDIWGWLIGLGTLSSLGLLVTNATSGEFIAATLNVFGIVVAVCFFLGLRWARYGLLVSLVLNVGNNVLSAEPGFQVQAASVFVFPLVIVLSILNDTRNQLFFKLDVSRTNLQKAWDLYQNNTAARAGVMLAFFSLIMPPIAPIALIASLVGLRNVDPEATPPIGRKGQAITGIVVSGLCLLIWGGVLISYLLSARAG